MRPLKPLVGLIGHSDFVSQESTFLQLEGRGLKQNTLYYALFSGHATARLKACWRKILPKRVHTMRSCTHALALNDISLIFF